MDVVHEFAEKVIIAVQWLCNIDPFAHLPPTALDNVAKFRGNCIRNSGRKSRVNNLLTHAYTTRGLRT